MTQPANPVIHVPAHKQMAPSKQPAQVRFPGTHPALQAPYGNVWVQAVKQDKEQAK